MKVTRAIPRIVRAGDLSAIPLPFPMMILSDPKRSPTRAHDHQRSPSAHEPWQIVGDHFCSHYTLEFEGKMCIVGLRGCAAAASIAKRRCLLAGGSTLRIEGQREGLV